MKKHDILVLNRAWVAIHIVGWEKAMSLLVKDNAKAMDRDLISYSFDDWCEFSSHFLSEKYAKIHTPTRVIAIPEIILLQNFDKLPAQEVKYSRQTLFQRDAHKCAYCLGVFSKNELTIDHILPRSRGGKTTWKNTISCCKTCNSKKANKTPEEAGMPLKFQPAKPGWMNPLMRRRADHPCESWFKFIDIPLMDDSK